MSETCRHCGAIVDYECNNASRCHICAEKLYGITLPPGPPAQHLKVSLRESIIVIDASIARMRRLVGNGDDE